MANISSRLKEAFELLDNGEADDAIKLGLKELDEDPDNPWVSYILSRAFMDGERNGASQVFAERHTRLAPDEPAGWINLGKAYHNNFNIEKGIECIEKGLSLNPNDVPGLNNIALCYIHLSNPVKALEYLDRAALIEPRNRDNLELRGFAQLMLQQWKEGWRNYNFGLGHSTDRRRRSYTDHIEPVWNGQRGQTVILYGEQGLGDEICFAQMIPQMIKDCNVIIETQARLENIFKRSFDVPVYGTRYVHDLEWPEYYKIDAVVSFSQAMSIYRQKNEDFSGKPYLKADPQKRKIWRSILDNYPGRKIGIAWNGGIKKTGKAMRSVPLECFKPLMNNGDTLVSLEYVDPAEEIKDTGILNFSPFINHKDYDDTAALVSELDLVVSVTTAVVDLCGGLGVNCDVLVPDKPHWRYYGESEKSIWYNSIRLIRQQGSWEETIRRTYG